MGAGLARERVAGATRQDTRGLSNGGTNSVSGILPGASLPFAGGARSHKARSHKAFPPSKKNGARRLRDDGEVCDPKRT